jgi:1,2-phenylacetyl-CoA epoxidase catalytic subunit
MITGRVEVTKMTIRTIIDMLTHYSKYIEIAEDLGVNNNYEELRQLRAYINYYDIDDMIDFLWKKIGSDK